MPDPAPPASGVAGRFEVVHAAPVAHADGDDEKQAGRLDDGADDVQPHALADAAVDHAADEKDDADGEQLVRRVIECHAEEFPELPDDRLRAGGHAGEAAHHHRDADHVAEQRLAQAALRDVGRAAGLRIASAHARIRKAGEHRADHRHQKGEPRRVAEPRRRLADERVDARAEHGAEAVKQDLPAPDGLAERGFRSGAVRHSCH